MSKIFSLIGLETNTGIRDIALRDGIPEVEDIQNSQVYRESLLIRYYSGV